MNSLPAVFTSRRKSHFAQVQRLMTIRTDCAKKEDSFQCTFEAMNHKTSAKAFTREIAIEKASAKWLDDFSRSSGSSFCN